MDNSYLWGHIGIQELEDNVSRRALVLLLEGSLKDPQHRLAEGGSDIRELDPLL
jgi:hypothetical protein